MLKRIIVAVSENDAIGRKNELLFKLKGDMKNFKDHTTDNIIVMGRKTYESIGNKPLPNRINVVISSKYDKKFIDDNGTIWYNSLEKALLDLYSITDYTKKILYIIGGGMVYKEALDKDIVDEIILTRVKQRVDDADTYFPRLDMRKWKVTELKSYDEGFNKQYDIAKYVKIR